jgi:branched-chain amino acid transport system ATP-binding protein
VLLLDEVAGGLTEPEVHQLVATIKRVRQAGVSIVWIEHIVHALLSVVDRIVAIDFGRKLIEGDPHTVMASPEVRDVYLGAEAVQ